MLSYDIPRVNRVLFRLCKILAKPPLDLFFRVRFVDNGVRALRPPYLVLCNHTWWLDPLIVSSHLPRPLHFVTNDEQFRIPHMRLIHRLFGSIPTRKYIPDASTPRAIMRVIRRGEAVAVYPEGERSWHGRSKEPIFATAKLCKALRVPVVLAVSRGSYLTMPRWADTIRRGRIEVEFRVLPARTVSGMDAEALHGAIRSGLEHDEYRDFQDRERACYRGKRLAESLELLLYTCTSCGEIGGMSSRGNQLRCTRCGATVVYSRKGYLHSRDDRLGYRTPREWDEWQRRNLTLLIERALEAGGDAPVLSDDGAVLYTGKAGRRLRSLGTGRLQLRPSGLGFAADTPAGGEHYLSIEGIRGETVQYNDRFELYHDDAFHRFCFERRGTSAYKWVTGLELLRQARSRHARAG